MALLELLNEYREPKFVSDAEIDEHDRLYDDFIKALCLENYLDYQTCAGGALIFLTQKGLEFLSKS